MTAHNASARAPHLNSIIRPHEQLQPDDLSEGVHSLVRAATPRELDLKPATSSHTIPTTAVVQHTPHAPVECNWHCWGASRPHEPLPPRIPARWCARLGFCERHEVRAPGRESHHYYNSQLQAMVAGSQVAKQHNAFTLASLAFGWLVVGLVCAGSGCGCTGCSGRTLVVAADIAHNTFFGWDRLRRKRSYSIGSRDYRGCRIAKLCGGDSLPGVHAPKVSPRMWNS